MLMNSMSSYYELGTSSVNPLSGTINNTNVIAANAGMPPLMLSSSKTAMSPEAKALAACKSHKEAERRRRKRINSHLSTLRTLLPNLIKTDKASILAEVVRRVRELKKTTSELTAHHRSDVDGCNACLIPGDIDEVKLCPSEKDSSILVATLCCEDRPDLIVDLTRALRSVKGRVVKAEIATVGGRTKSVLWVRGVTDGSSSGGGPEGMLKRALKVVVDKPSSSFGLGHGLMGSRFHHLY